MTRRAASTRSGITLTEILISIGILGVGMISLATLFPLGLVRLRNAQRLTRGAYLAESAAADLGSRNLFAKGTFYPGNLYYFNSVGGYYDPWVQDTPVYGGNPYTPNAPGVSRTLGPGLPVAYDPLWRFQTGIYPNPTGNNTVPEARFGSGLYVIPTPDYSDGGLPSANGLQRLTNLYANTINVQTNYQVSTTILQAFISPEDVIFQEAKGQYYNLFANGNPPVINPSTVVPDLNMGMPTNTNANTSTTIPSVTNDWRYSWFFTGQQSDATNGTVFDGDIVICENRSLGVDNVTTPAGNLVLPSGERVVEAWWGYSSTYDKTTFPAIANTSIGYGAGVANRTVVLRWPATQPDPDIRVGSWIADVTYERSAVLQLSRYPNTLYPAQRCYWYRIAKRTDPVPDPVANYRRVSLTTSTPLRAMSLLNFANTPATPVHVEAALIMPSVVNVYPRTVYTR